MINVAQLDLWFTVIGFFVVTGLLSRPRILRALGRWIQRADEWALARAGGANSDEDPDLWLWYRRRRMCEDLRRIERLLVTDMGMSATRQLGNRLAYRQLLADLRRTPDVYPATLESPAAEWWNDGTVATGASAQSGHGFGRQPPAVEVLEIGWGRRPA